MDDEFATTVARLPPTDRAFRRGREARRDSGRRAAPRLPLSLAKGSNVGSRAARHRTTQRVRSDVVRFQSVRLDAGAQEGESFLEYSLGSHMRVRVFGPPLA
jgi:hypothetical protein